MPRTGILLAD